MAQPLALAQAGGKLRWAQDTSTARKRRISHIRARKNRVKGHPAKPKTSSNKRAREAIMVRPFRLGLSRTLRKIRRINEHGKVTKRKWRYGATTNKWVRTTLTQSNLKLGTINIRGINDPTKRLTVEEWAAKQKVNVVCVSETQRNLSTCEQGVEQWVDEEQIKGDWKWFFSSGVEPTNSEKADKLRKNGKYIPEDLRKSTR